MEPAVSTLSPSPSGFTASDIAARGRAISELRGKHIVARIGRTRRYETLPSGLRAMTALIPRHRRLRIDKVFVGLRPEVPNLWHDRMLIFHQMKTVVGVAHV